MSIRVVSSEPFEFLLSDDTEIVNGVALIDVEADTAAAAAAQAAADAAQVTANAALAAAGLAATAINVRTVADLPAPVGNIYTLTAARYHFVGDVVIPNGFQIVDPVGAFVLCEAPGSATITGSHPTALIVMQGGGLANVRVVNTHGGAAADVQHFGGLNVDGVRLEGAGTQLRHSGVGAIIEYRNVIVRPSAAASGTRSIVFDATCIYQAVAMPAGVEWANLWALTNIKAIEIEVGAIIVDWQFASGTIYNHPSSPDGCVGIHNLGTILKFLFSATPMLYFDGAGSTELVGIDPTLSIITGVSSGTSSLTSTAINSSVFGALERSGAGVATALTGGATWDPLVVTGDVLGTPFSLLSRPASGQLAATWVVSPTTGKAKCVVTLSKIGGSVPVLIRIELSTDNGLSWTPISLEFETDVSTVAKQVEAEVNIRLAVGHRLRVAANAPGGAVTISTTTYRLGIGA